MSAARLLRALAASAQTHGCAAEFALTRTRDWASAVFAGARFDVTATLGGGADAERWIRVLPAANLAMPRQFARDVSVIARTDADDRITLTIEALVLED